jgi:hypothetical protein
MGIGYWWESQKERPLGRPRLRWVDNINIHINIAQSNATYMLFVLFLYLPYMFRLVTTIIRGTYHHRNTITHGLFTIQLIHWVWYK